MVIVIYSPKPQGEGLAATLAVTAGNGQGLAAWPEQAGALGALPAQLPPDFRLTGLAVYTEAQILAAVTQAAAEGGEVPAEVQELLQTLRMFVPRQLVVADYRGPGGKEWHSMLAEYAAPSQAWQNWQLLTWTAGFGGTGMKVPAQSGEASGLLFSEADAKLLLYRAGPYLVLLGAPADASPSQLGSLATALQI